MKRIAFALALIALPFAAYADPAPPANVAVPFDLLNAVYTHLAAEPYKDVAKLLPALEAAVGAQMQKNAIPVAPIPAPPAPPAGK